MKPTKLIGIGLLILLPFLLMALFRPVDIHKNNCLKVDGVVESITEATSYDVVVKLANNSTHYYVNRGLERGLDLANLKETLVGQEIELWHAKTWYISGGHIVQLQIGEEIIYSEWE